MKASKLIGAVFFIALLTAIFCAVSVSAIVYEPMKIPEGYSIEIDGKVDPLWTAVPSQPVEMKDLTKFSDTDATATIKYLWDDNGYYVLVEVDRHGTEIVSPCSNQPDAINYTDDSVYFGTVNGGNEQAWTHAGLRAYEYTGLVCGDADGNRNLYGWYDDNAQDKVKYSLRLVDTDKFNVEMYFDWIDPMNSYCYGPAGVGEGSVIMCDATIWLHNADGSTSFLAWNMDYWDQMSSPHFGYLVLSGDEVDVSLIKEEETHAETPDATAEETADGTVVTPAEKTDADTTGEKTVEEKNGSADKKDGKKENAPETLDAASIIAMLGIVSFGSAIIVKKKRR